MIIWGSIRAVYKMSTKYLIFREGILAIDKRYIAFLSLAICGLTKLLFGHLDYVVFS